MLRRIAVCMALGGSCEFILHCDRTVAALESYVGLVETGVGLLPAGGGSKELALRAAIDVRRGANGGQLDLFPFLRTYFQNVAKATVSKSAPQALELGYLQPADTLVMRIEPRSDGVYFAQFSGDRKETSFRLAGTQTADKDTIFTFANIAADAFPARLVYRRGSEGWLYETIEGTLNGSERKVIYPLRRVDCETGEFILR